MKSSNLNVAQVNESNQLQPVLESEKNDIFEKMEKCYGFKMDFSVLICEDRQFGENGISEGFTYKFGMVPRDDAISRMKGGYNVCTSCVSFLDELYEITLDYF